jgi:hypothetical protein
LFQWRLKEIERTVDAMVQAGELLADYTMEGQTGEWFVIANLVS